MHVSLVPVVLPAIFQGLQDRDDDVRAVSAAALNPVADMLIQVLPHEVSRGHTPCSITFTFIFRLLICYFDQSYSIK